jgi:hypothetical protein
MEDDKKCEVGNFLKFHSNNFWLINSKQNLIQIFFKESFSILHIP